MLAIAAQTAEPNWLKSLKKKKTFFQTGTSASE